MEFALRNGISLSEMKEHLDLAGGQECELTSLTMVEYINLINWMAIRLNEPALGLRLSEEISPSEFGDSMYMIYHAATLKDCFHGLAQYDQALSEGINISFSEGVDICRLEYRLNIPSTYDGSQEIELGMALMIKFSRQLLGDQWHPKKIEFTHKPNTSLEEYERFFGPNVLFEQPVNMALSYTQDLDTPIVDADPNLLKILRAHADSLREKNLQSGDILGRVRFYIASTLGTDKCSAEKAAEYIYMSRRNLTRHLGSRNFTFRALRNEIIEEVAKQALSDMKTPVGEIALRLGYSESSAFDRAFKNFTGYTPMQYRKITQAQH